MTAKEPLVADWTVADIPPQDGRRFVITGANSGIGEQLAIALTGAGAQVTMACRNVDKGRAVAGRIGPAATVVPLDLADLRSVRDFADGFDGAEVLINNAGVMAVPLQRTRDGFEMQIGTNHLGHFALTGLILPRLTERVVTVSSLAHRWARLDLDDISWERRRYNRWIAYGDSKLANLMFGLELGDRLAAAGSPVRSVLAHPGYATTGLLTHTEAVLGPVFRLADLVRVSQPAAAGALPPLYAATSPDAEPNAFYGPDKLWGLRGAPTRTGYRKAAGNAALRRRLWAESETLTGVKFPL